MADRLQWDSFDWLLSDGDLINVTIEHNVAPANQISFVLESGPYINWWKALQLPDGQEIWTQDARTRDATLVPLSGVLHGDLVLGKAKFLGLHQAVYLLDASRLQARDRVTFTWLRDGAPWRNDSWLQQDIHAPFIEGRGYWVRPGSQFGCTINVTNRGDAWYPGARYKLGSWDPPDNLTWGLGRVDLDDWLGTVGPLPHGALLDFTVTAPTTAGEYNFSWRMVQEGVQWFGESTGSDVTSPGISALAGDAYKLRGTVIVADVQPMPYQSPPPTDHMDPPPPPPPPQFPTSGESTVSMAQHHDPGAPGAWYLYDATAVDPALHTLRGGPPAHVLFVKNISSYSFSLAHRDPHGNQTPSVILDRGESTSLFFQGMEVEGDWIAQVESTEAMAPSSLSISISWSI
jgi:hypothetical protein